MNKLVKFGCILFMVMLLADPVLGAVKLTNISMQNGVNTLQQEESLSAPLEKILLFSIGLVFFLGLIALIKCGGLTFIGITIGKPHSTADGFYGMCSVLVMGLSLTAGIGLYMSWM